MQPLSKATIERLKALSELPDEQIDTSDIPELDDAWFKKALLVPAATRDGNRNWHARVEEAMASRQKKAISLRVEPDVLDWFKSQGPRYQSRMNAVLKAYMESQKS